MSDPQPETVAVMNWIRFDFLTIFLRGLINIISVDIHLYCQQIFMVVILSQIIHMMPVVTDRCLVIIKVSLVPNRLVLGQSVLVFGSLVAIGKLEVKSEQFYLNGME